MMSSTIKIDRIYDVIERHREALGNIELGALLRALPLTAAGDPNPEATCCDLFSKDRHSGRVDRLARCRRFTER
jgi:hypothetical protein